MHPSHIHGDVWCPGCGSAAPGFGPKCSQPDRRKGAQDKQLILVGELERDPRVLKVPAGVGYLANVPLLTEGYVNGGERYALFAIGRMAEAMRDHLTKGERVWVQGSINGHSRIDLEDGREETVVRVIVRSFARRRGSVTLSVTKNLPGP